jgi:hypothetical protein
LKCGSYRGIIHRSRKTIKKGATIGLSTIRRKKAREGLKAAFGKEDMVNWVYLSAVLNSQILHWHLVEFFLETLIVHSCPRV